MISRWAVSFVLAVLNQPVAVPILYATVICATFERGTGRCWQRTVITEILASTLSVFALVEWSSLFYYVVAAFNPQAKFGILSEQLETNLTYSLYPLAIPIMLLLSILVGMDTADLATSQAEWPSTLSLPAFAAKA